LVLRLKQMHSGNLCDENERFALAVF
jgi:hypothetical protein